MSAANFPKALRAVLAYEGGYSNHPRDRGGVTLEGIIQRVYDGYRKRKGRPLRPLTAAMRGAPEWIAERDDIYRTQYWNAVRADELPAGLDLVMFDCAVNSGPYQAALWLQRALHMNDCDGHIGEGTLMMAQAHPDHDALIAELLARRLGMLRNLDSWEDFKSGWSRRVGSVKAIGQAMALGSVGPEPVEIEADACGKGYASDVQQPPVSEDAGKGATAGGATIATTLEVAKETVQPYVGTSGFMTKVYVGLTVLAIVIAIAGAAYVWWAARKTKRAKAAINGEVVADIDELDAAVNGAAA